MGMRTSPSASVGLVEGDRSEADFPMVAWTPSGRLVRADFVSTVVALGKSFPRKHVWQAKLLLFGASVASDLMEAFPMDLLHEVCCGLDVHKASVVACRISGKGRKKKKELRSFETVAAGLKEMGQWLQSSGCTCAAMEGTGVYWMPVYEALEGLIPEVIVANAQHIKHVPGRKTDAKDSEWICELARHGLLRPGFVPAKDIRQLRELTRSRHKAVQSCTTERNRLLKLLERAGIKLASFLSDVFGVSGRAMLSALIEGKKSPEQMAALAKGTLKRKAGDIRRALEAPMSDSTRFLLRVQYESILEAEKRIGLLDTQIAEMLAPYGQQFELLQTIVGIGAVAAAAILGEVGVDLQGFRHQGAFASWCGVTPGNNMSAGKRKNAPAKSGNLFMRALLVECAWAAIKSPGYLQTKYYKLKARRGAKRAIGAIAHKLAVAIYQVLTKNEPYRELGPEHFEQQARRQATVLARRLVAQGYLVVPPSAPTHLSTPQGPERPILRTPTRSKHNKRKTLRC